MRTILLALLCACPLLAGALEMGAPAPKLTGVTWVKGEAAQPGDGTVTVVEFWATWCPPCRDSIPHLTALQKQYGARLRIIGLSNEDEATVKPFVAEWGERMDYRVGVIGDAGAQAYMEGIPGIPHAFLVDGDGTVVWHGMPMAMDGVLAQLLAGTLDRAKVMQLAKLESELIAMIQGQQPQLEPALAKTAAILAIDPVNLQAIELRMAIAQHLQRPEVVRSTLEAVPVASLTATQAASLARQRLAEEDLAQRHLDLALAFASHARAIAPQALDARSAYAAALYALGLVEQAAAEQAAALALSPDDADAKAALDYYRGVLALQAKQPAR